MEKHTHIERDRDKDRERGKRQGREREREKKQRKRGREREREKERKRDTKRERERGRERRGRRMMVTPELLYILFSHPCVSLSRVMQCHPLHFPRSLRQDRKPVFFLQKAAVQAGQKQLEPHLLLRNAPIAFLHSWLSGQV